MKSYRGSVYVHTDVKEVPAPPETKTLNTWVVKVIGTLMKCNKTILTEKRVRFTHHYDMS